MNKKGQVAQIIVYVVLFIVGLVAVGMLESESNFISDTISDFIDTSDNKAANLVMRFIVPIFFGVFIVGGILVIRGSFI